MAVARASVLVALTIALWTSPAAAAIGRTGSTGRSLQQYLSSMSWPVRASILRARSVSDRIDGWIADGDPPFLGGIAASCRSLRAVEARGRLLRIDPPQQLGSSHARLMRAYSAARAGCRQARLEALAARAALSRAFRTQSATDRQASDRETLAACTQLRRFAGTTLLAFGRAVATWRSAALSEAQAHGAAASWLQELRVQVPRGAYSRPCPPPS